MLVKDLLCLRWIRVSCGQVDYKHSLILMCVLPLSCLKVFVGFGSLLSIAISLGMLACKHCFMK